MSISVDSILKSLNDYDEYIDNGSINSITEQDIIPLIQLCSKEELMSKPLLVELAKRNMVSAFRVMYLSGAYAHSGKALDEALNNNSIPIVKMIIKNNLNMNYYLIKVPYLTGSEKDLLYIARIIAKSKRQLYGDVTTGYVLGCIKNEKEYMIKPFISSNKIHEEDFNNAAIQARYALKDYDLYTRILNVKNNLLTTRW